jgi:hypothetical protein
MNVFWFVIVSLFWTIPTALQVSLLYSSFRPRTIIPFSIWEIGLSHEKSIIVQNEDELMKNVISALNVFMCERDT